MRIGTVLLTAIAAGVAAMATAADAPVAALSALDYAEIQQLANRYAYALDHCTADGKRFADLFAEDGALGATDDPDKDPEKTTSGREALLRTGTCRGDPQSAPNAGATHLTLGLLITAAPGGATGWGTSVLVGANHQPLSMVPQGWKKDFYVRTAQGWRIKSTWHVRIPPQP